MNIIPKFQQGGWSQFFAGATYPSQQQTQQTTQTTQPTQKKESPELTIKDVFNLIKDVKGLPNDMALLTQNLQNMYALYERTGDVDALARMYLRNLYQLKVNVFNQKEYEDAKKVATDNGSLEEYAITPAGKLVVQFEDGTIQEVAPSEYHNLNRNCAILTNNDLLNLRAQSPNLINDNSVLSIVNNGIGMEKVSELILKHFQNLGTSEYQRSGPTWVINGQRYGAYELVAKTIEQLNGGFELYGQAQLRPDGTYDTQVISKQQTEQFKQALSWLIGSLPKNALQVLTARAAIDGIDPEKLLTNLIGSTMSVTNTIKFTYDEFDEESTGGRSSGSSEDPKDLKYGIASEWVKGYGALGIIRISPGTTDNFYVQANSLPLADANNNITGGNYITVKDLENTSFAGILRVPDATVCGQRLGTISSSAIYIASNSIYNVDFPVDPNNPDMPNLKHDSKQNTIVLSQWANQYLGINFNNQQERAKYVQYINVAAKKLGMSDQLLNVDGSYKEPWKNFGVMEVIFEENAIDLSKADSTLYTPLTDEETEIFINTMQRNGNKNYKPEGTLYKATVWIPVDNYLMASVLGLDKLDPNQAVNIAIQDNINNRQRTPVNINTNTTGK